MLARPNPYARLKLTHPKVIDIFENPKERVKECEEDCWRLRSPDSGYSSDFCRVRTDGTVIYDASYSYGVAPAFCI